MLSPSEKTLKEKIKSLEDKIISMKKFIEEILIDKNENFLEMFFFFFLFNKIDLKKGITKLKKTMKTKLILIRVLLLLF